MNQTQHYQQSNARLAFQIVLLLLIVAAQLFIMTQSLRAYMEADHEFLWFAFGISSLLLGLAVFSLLFIRRSSIAGV